MTTPSPDSPFAPDWNVLDRRRTPEWFEQARIGLFIHYGPYSNVQAQPGRREYERPEHLTAEAFDAAAWVRLARRCGFRYLTVTAKHGGGYAMFNTRYGRWNSCGSGPRRDVIGELTQACKQDGMRFIAYYCKDDMFLPDDAPMTSPFPMRDRLRFERIVKDYDMQWVRENWTDYFQGQIRELTDNYPIDGIWFDGTRLPSEYVGTRPLLADLYNRFPDIVINDRIGTAFERKKHGDFFTYERAWLKPVHILPHPWERAEKLSKDWWWTGDDGPLGTCASDLLWDMIETMALGGNYAVGVGPKPDGTIPSREIDVLSSIGDWLGVNGEAVYGTCPWTWGYSRQGDDLRFTLSRDENTVYAFFRNWPGPEGIRLDRFNDGMPIAVSMQLLATGQPLAWRNAERCHLALPAKPPEGLPVYVIKIEIERHSILGREGRHSSLAQE